MKRDWMNWWSWAASPMKKPTPGWKLMRSVRLPAMEPASVTAAADWVTAAAAERAAVLVTAQVTAQVTALVTAPDTALATVPDGALAWVWAAGGKRNLSLSVFNGYRKQSGGRVFSPAALSVEKPFLRDK